MRLGEFGFTQDRIVIRRGMHDHVIDGRTVLRLTDEASTDLARTLGSVMCNLTPRETANAFGLYIQPGRAIPLHIVNCPYEHSGRGAYPVTRSTGVERRGLGFSGWIEETVWLGGSCNFCGGSGRLVF